MFEVSEIIYSILNADATLTSLGIDVQPIAANQYETLPIVVYAISEEPKSSKDGVYPYEIAIRVYADTYKQTLQIIDAVYNAIAAAEGHFKYNGTQQPQMDVFGEYYTESNYSFKK